MSVHSNFQKDRCWSCEFFCGQRKYKNGIVFGDSVETEAKGTCSNQRSSYCGKAVRDNDWCGKYQKWGVLQSALALQQQVCQPAKRCEEAERSPRGARGKQREKAEKTLKRNAMIAFGICIAGLVIMFVIAFCIYSVSKIRRSRLPLASEFVPSKRTCTPRPILPKRSRAKNNTNSLKGFVLFTHGAEGGI